MECSGSWDRLDALITLSCLIFSIAGEAQGYLFGGRKLNPTEDVMFHIYHRHSSRRSSRIFVNTSESLLRCEWAPAKPTKIIIHGWQSRIAEGSAGINLKNTLLELVDVNVITVDWSYLYSLWYPSSKDSAAPVVAEEVSKLLKLLVAAGGNLEQMHLIGHSLGAHILGVAARDQIGTVGKITALDPAGPSFEDRRLIGYWRLSPDDAGFVEVVHTDAGRLGYEGSLGHVDFRPGGGKGPQRGCGRDYLGICSHCLSWEVYRHALSHPGELVGTRCHSWVDFKEGVCAGNPKLALSLDTDTTRKKIPSDYFPRKTVREKAETMFSGKRSQTIVFFRKTNSGPGRSQDDNSNASDSDDAVCPPPPKACRYEYSGGSSCSHAARALSEDYSDDESPSDPGPGPDPE